LSVAKDLFSPKNLHILSEEILDTIPVDGLLFEESRNRTLKGRLLFLSRRGDKAVPCLQGRDLPLKAEDLPPRPLPDLKSFGPRIISPVRNPSPGSSLSREGRGPVGS